MSCAICLNAAGTRNAVPFMNEGVLVCVRCHNRYVRPMDQQLERARSWRAGVPNEIPPPPRLVRT